MNASLRRFLAALVLAAAALGLPTATALAVGEAAAPPDPVVHGKVGPFAIVDTPEYAGLGCEYQSLALDSIEVRRPIIYARDRTSAVDHQQTGWRWELMKWNGTVGEYQQAEVGPTYKAQATDVTNAFWTPKVVSSSIDPMGIYRVRYRLYWYTPGTTSTVQGRAVVWPIYYALPGSAAASQVHTCYATQPKGITPTPPGGHSGTYGPHMLFDTLGYPTLTCVRGGGAGAPLKSLRIRAPIVFGVSGVPRVGWEIIVQWNDGDPASGPWTTEFTSSIQKRGLATAHNADFRPRTYDFHGHAGDHLYWRATIRMFWYRSNGTVLGRATHAPAFSLQTFPNDTPAHFDDGYCSKSVF